MTRRTAGGRLLRGLAVLVMCAALVFPVYWMFVTSVSPANDLRTFPPRFLPIDPDWSSYAHLLERPLWRWMGNSFVVAAASASVSAAVSVLAGYGLSRFRVRGTRMAGTFILTSRMLPSTLLVIPLFTLFTQASLVGSRWSLVIAHVTFIIPFATWMLKGYFDSIPQELDHAAIVDGCSRMGAIVRVLVPVAKPGIAATVLYGFILSWDDFVFARTFVSGNQLSWTVSLGVSSLRGEYITGWNEVMAAALVGSAPIVIMYVFLERFLVAGLSAGAVKS